MRTKKNKAAEQLKRKPQHNHFFHHAVNTIVSPNFLKLKKANDMGATDFRAQTALDMSSHFSGRNDMTLSSFFKISDNFMAPYAFVMLKQFNPKDPQGMIHEFCSLMKVYYGEKFDRDYIIHVISTSLSVLRTIFLSGSYVLLEV